MRDRSTLDRLSIGFECRSSWESMEGEGARRWCGECRKHVLDLAQLTGAEIETRLLASRGELCVRLTRRDGRLITAPEPELPLRALVAPPRRAAALAAGVVTACLGALAAERAGSAAGAPAVAAAPQHPQPRPSPPDRMPAGPSGSLRGRLSADGKPLRGAAITARNTFDGSETRTTTAADGAFAFRELPTGMYEVEGRLDGYTIDGQAGIAVQPGEQGSVDVSATAAPESILAGALVMAQAPLREVFDKSDLVVEAVFGASRVVERADDHLAIVTELQVVESLKARVAERTIVYRHTEYVGAGEEPETWRDETAPGTKVLAFLKRGDDGLRLGRQLVLADWNGIRQELPDADRAAYVERLRALATLEERAHRRGETSADDLVEWLVGTVEDPHTRNEATGDLLTALRALAEVARRENVPVEVAAADLQALADRFRSEGGVFRQDPPAVLIGASLSTGQRARLLTALRASSAIDAGSRMLYQIVRELDSRAADGWLLERLRGEGDQAVAADDEEDITWWLRDVAAEIGDDGVRDLAAAATAREQAVFARINEQAAAGMALSPEAQQAMHDALNAIARELRRDFAAALARVH